MKNINVCVKQFKKENKIVFPTWRKLVHIAKKNDWKLTPFNKAKKLIQEHKLEKYIKKHRAFAYEYADEKIILYRDNLKGYNRLHTILHEMGHIYLGHTFKLDKSENEEVEADEFAELLLNGYKNALTFTSILALASIATVYFLNLTNNDSEDNIKEISTSIIEIAIDPTIEATTVVPTEATVESTESTAGQTTQPNTEEIAEENDKILFYVSATGTKYHTKDCYHINPEKCTALPLDKILEMGYTPCKTCEPDKRG